MAEDSSGQGFILALVGRSGTGKTTLLMELLNSFAPGGLARAADELEQFVAGQHPQDVRRVT